MNLCIYMDIYIWDMYMKYIWDIYTSLVLFLSGSSLPHMNSPQAQLEGAVDSYLQVCQKTRQYSTQSHLKPLLELHLITSLSKAHL